MEISNVINTRLLGHPLNWAIVWVIVALACMAYGVIHDAVDTGKAATSLSPD